MSGEVSFQIAGYLWQDWQHHHSINKRNYEDNVNDIIYIHNVMYYKMNQEHAMPYNMTE